jgi:photosystem II stability/assembly factor-like uncharacterized protein
MGSPFPLTLFRIGLVTLLVVAGQASRAHDAGSYGGVFRSRDFGATWLNADVGLFLNAPLAIAVNPRDPSHLLMGTDLGLLSSRNGGRSWEVEADDLIVGAVFAVAFHPEGRQAVCAGQGGVFRFEANRWIAASLPAGTLPGRALAGGAGAERVYLLGGGRLLRSDDGGRNFARLPRPGGEDVTALAVVGAERETVMAVVGGTVMTSEDAGATWRSTALGSPAEPVDAIAVEADPARVWAAHSDRLYASSDRGATWVLVGHALPERATTVRGIAADRTGTILVVTTHRGTYRSIDGGRSWALLEGNLPGHLEAGPLSRDPGDRTILYAPYALVPYAEVWRAAVEGRPLIARLDLVAFACAASFALILCAGGFAVRRLTRVRATAPAGNSRVS